MMNFANLLTPFITNMMLLPKIHWMGMLIHKQHGLNKTNKIFLGHFALHKLQKDYEDVVPEVEQRTVTFTTMVNCQAL